MKKICIVLIAIMAISCNNSTTDNSGGKVKIEPSSSYVQKGPFSVGSTILIQTLDSDFFSDKQLPNSEIEDYTGRYLLNLNGTSESTYLQIIAEGKFYNEVSGELSIAPLKLKGLGLANNENINVNVLTHITNDRIITILKSTETTLEQARKQVVGEILAIFGVNESEFSKFSNFNEANLLGSSKTDAFLLAVSAIFIDNETRSVSVIEKLLADFSLDFSPDGVLSNESVLRAIEIGKSKSETEINEILDNIKYYTSENNIDFNGLNIKPYFNIIVKSTELPIVNNIPNGEFTESTNNEPRFWYTEVGHGGEGQIENINNELVFTIDNPGEKSWSLYTATTGNLNLINGKSYSVIIDVESNKSDSKVLFAVEGTSPDRLITKSYSDGWSDFNIDGSTISKVFTYLEDSYTPYLAVQFGSGLTTAGTVIKLKSCKIVEVEKINLNPRNENWWTSNLNDAAFTVTHPSQREIKITIDEPGSVEYNDWELQIIAPSKIPALKNGDVYQLFFKGSTPGTDCKLKPILLSNDKSETIWVDHIGNFADTYTITSETKNYSTHPFIIENLQTEAHHFKFYFGGTQLSYKNAEYNLSDISLYKLKVN